MPNRVWRAALAVVWLAAFALRLWNLEGQSIWGDEAFSIFTARQEIGYVVSGGADTHPPLYHWLLHYWMEATGRSAFALRMLSVGWSLLCVAAGTALAHGIARDRRVALLAAVLIAVSPFQIFYAQETRMYAQVAALCALSLHFCLRWLDARAGAPQRGALLLWIVTTLLALYTHYFAFFVLAAQDLYLLLVLWQRNRHAAQRPYVRRAAGALLLAHALWLLAYLPWINVQRDYLSRQANARAGVLSVPGAWDVLSRTLATLFAGTTLDNWLQVGAGLLCVGLALMGWRASTRIADPAPSTPPRAHLLLLAVCVPIAGAIAVNPLLPFFRERFLLPASVPFLVLLAMGIWQRVRSARAGALLLLLSVSALALGNYWYDARYHRGEYAQAIAAIRAEAAAGDALIRYAPIQDALWDYYRIADMPDYVLPGADLIALAGKHPRVWLLLYGDPAVFDPPRAAERLLGEIGFRAFYQSYRDGALARYDFPLANTPLTPARARLGDGVVLAGYSVPAQVVRGATLPVRLEWQASAQLAEDYTVFVHLLGADGKPVAQMDTQPLGGARPTRTWKAGETLSDRIGVAIPAGLPPGNYRVAVGMYLLRTLERLPVREPAALGVLSDALILGEVEVR